MAEKNKNRCRKSKLVPRETLDFEDENIFDLQNEIDMQIKQIKTEVIDYDYKDLDNETEDIDMPLQFSIKVEVEELDDVNNKDKSRNELTTASPLVEPSVVESNVDLDLDQNSNSEATGPDTFDIKLYRTEIKAIYLYEGDENDACTEADNVSETSSSLSDKILAKEVRNYCGVLAKQQNFRTVLNEKVHAIYKDWKLWCLTTSKEEPPLYHKCYICLKSWWYLTPFLDHVKEHKLDECKIYLETDPRRECNIVCANRNENNRLIYTEGNCWKCGNRYMFHEQMMKKYGQYKCRGCNKRFDLCSTLIAHENSCFGVQHSNDIVICTICNNMFDTRFDFEQHNLNTHDVRSDVPVLLNYITCVDCKEIYVSGCHTCPGKYSRYACVHCNSGFIEKQFLEIHRAHTQKNVKCEVCGATLPMKCKQLEHHLTHTKNFELVSKCALCMDIYLFANINAMTLHLKTWHQKDYNPKRNYFVPVLLPVKCFKKLRKIPWDTPFYSNIDDDTATSSKMNSRRLTLSEKINNLKNLNANSLVVTEIHNEMIPKIYNVGTLKTYRTLAPKPPKSITNTALATHNNKPVAIQTFEVVTEDNCPALVPLSTMKAKFIRLKPHVYKSPAIQIHTALTTDTKKTLIALTPNTFNVSTVETHTTLINNTNKPKTTENYTALTSKNYKTTEQKLPTSTTDTVLAMKINESVTTENHNAPTKVTNTVFETNKPKTTESHKALTTWTNVKLEIEADRTDKIKSGTQTTKNDEALQMEISELETTEVNKESNVTLEKEIDKSETTKLDTASTTENNKALEMETNESETTEINIELIKVTNATLDMEIDKSKTSKLGTSSTTEKNEAMSKPIQINKKPTKKPNATLEIKANKSATTKINKTPTTETDSVKTEIIVNKSLTTESNEVLTTIPHNELLFAIKNIKQEVEVPPLEHSLFYATIRKPGEDSEIESFYNQPQLNENDSTYAKLMTNIFQGSDTETGIKAEVIDEDISFPTEDLDEEAQLVVDTEQSLIDSDEPELVMETEDPVTISSDSEEYAVIKRGRGKSKRDASGRRIPKIYACNRCGYKSIHRAYRQHMDSMCMIRPIPVNSKYVPKKIIETELSLHKCNGCGVTYHSLMRYLMHFALKHGYTPMTCPVCSDAFDFLPKMMSHFCVHVKKNYIKMLTIDSKVTAKTHKRYHNCKQCKIAVKTDKFFEHWCTHFEVENKNVVVVKEEPLELPGPEIPTDSYRGRQLTELEKGTLLYNLLSFGPTVGTRRPCPLCNHLFKRMTDKKRHLIEHLVLDAFAKKPTVGHLRCQICHADHSKVDAYKLHMREHASLPVYKCEICNKSFSDSSNFVKHKKLHNENAYCCDICQRKFQAKASIEKHMKIHETLEPIKCRLCGKVSFTPSAHKKHHRMTHEKSKARFRCLMCDLSFVKLKDKWDHVWDAHNERNFEADCPWCDMSFRKFQDVKSHVRMEHPNVPLKTLGSVMSMKHKRKKEMKAEELKNKEIEKKKETETNNIEEFLKNKPRLRFNSDDTETLLVIE